MARHVHGKYGNVDVCSARLSNEVGAVRQSWVWLWVKRGWKDTASVCVVAPTFNAYELKTQSDQISIFCSVVLKTLMPPGIDLEWIPFTIWYYSLKVWLAVFQGIFISLAKFVSAFYARGGTNVIKSTIGIISQLKKFFRSNLRWYTLPRVYFDSHVSCNLSGTTLQNLQLSYHGGT